MTAPTRQQITPAELGLLQRTRRPGDEVAYYLSPQRGGWFLLVGPCSPMQTAPATYRGRKLAGYIDIQSGAIVPLAATVAA